MRYSEYVNRSKNNIIHFNQQLMMMQIVGLVTVSSETFFRSGWVKETELQTYIYVNNRILHIQISLIFPRVCFNIKKQKDKHQTQSFDYWQYFYVYYQCIPSLFTYKQFFSYRILLRTINKQPPDNLHSGTNRIKIFIFERPTNWISFLITLK